MEIKDEFVVHLQKHVGFFAAQHFLNADHGDFNEVGGGALDRRVDGVALGGGADGSVMTVDVADVTAASGDGFDIALFFGGFDGAVHEGFYRRILCKVVFDNFGGFFARDTQALRKAEGGDAVDDSEVNHFGAAALLFGHFVERYSENTRGGGGMNIFAVDEGLLHAFVAAEVRHDTQPASSRRRAG